MVAILISLKEISLPLLTIPVVVPITDYTWDAGLGDVHLLVHSGFHALGETVEVRVLSGRLTEMLTQGRIVLTNDTVGH